MPILFKVKNCHYQNCSNKILQPKSTNRQFITKMVKLVLNHTSITFGGQVSDENHLFP